MTALSSSDRLLVVAVHPDDESLATGCLLQRACAVGAAVRVLFVTDGDNNPWPQRFVEKRWRISPADRTRWGARRLGEARRALVALGAGAVSTAFLHLPDQGVTSLLLERGDGFMTTVRREIELFAPTLVVGPSLVDAHPDHNATSVVLRLILDATPVRHWEYVVHAPKLTATPALTGRVTLSATDSERERKLAAILCHATQMALSRRRFSAFAARDEWYLECERGPAWQGEHPVRFAAIEDGTLCLILPRPRPKGIGNRLLVAGLDQAGRLISWSLHAPSSSGPMPIHTQCGGDALAEADVQQRETRIELALRFPGLVSLAQVFIKPASRTLFYDRAGWREIAIEQCLPCEPESGCYH